MMYQILAVSIRFCISQSAMLFYLFLGIILLRRAFAGRIAVPGQEMAWTFSAASILSAAGVILSEFHYSYFGMLVTNSLFPIALVVPFANRYLASTQMLFKVLVPFTGISPDTSIVMEELLAYPQLFSFVFLFLVWLHDEGFQIWKAL